MTRILVTGGFGFVGRALLPLLEQAGVELHAVTSRSLPAPRPGITWHRCDLLDPVAAARLLQQIRPSHLVHLAWITEHGVYWTSPRNQDWLKASIGLFEQFQRGGGRHALITGTCAEYGPSSVPCCEDVTATGPTTPYGRAKLELLAELEPRAATGSVRLVWARLFHLYGPHEGPARLVPAVIQSLLQGRAVACTSGTQLRDYAYIGNVASSLVALLRSDFAGTVNVASGEARAVRSVIEAVANLLGRPDLPQFGAMATKPSEPDVLIANIARLRSVVGSKAEIDFTTAMQRTIECYRADFLGGTQM